MELGKYLGKLRWKHHKKQSNMSYIIEWLPVLNKLKSTQEIFASVYICYWNSPVEFGSLHQSISISITDKCPAVQTGEAFWVIFLFPCNLLEKKQTQNINTLSFKWNTDALWCQQVVLWPSEKTLKGRNSQQCFLCRSENSLIDWENSVPDVTGATGYTKL